MPDETESPKMVRINVPLPEDLHTALKLRAVREKKDIKDLVPELLKLAMQQGQPDA